MVCNQLYFQKAQKRRNELYSDREGVPCRSVCAEKCRHYLRGGPEFEENTDHNALKWLFCLKEPKGGYARWMMEI